MPTPDPRRGVRTALLGTALAALTMAGHTAAGGAADVVGTALVVGLAVLLGAAMSARRLRPARVLAVLLAGQAFLHLVLTFASGHAHPAGTTGPSAPTMIAAHAVAAVLATGLVVRADSLARAWGRFLAVVLGARPTVQPVPRTTTTTRRRPPHVPLSAVLLDDHVVRRGPPAAHAFA